MPMGGVSSRRAVAVGVLLLVGAVAGCSTHDVAVERPCPEVSAKKVAAMAEAYEVAVAPHNMSGPVSTAASVHLAATLPNFLILEYCWGATPWRADLVDGAEAVVDGHIPLPTRPGLGVGLNRAALDAHRLAATAIFT